MNLKTHMPSPLAGSEANQLPKPKRKRHRKTVPWEEDRRRRPSIAGKVFSRLTVLSHNGRKCVCLCSCGVQKEMYSYNVKSGNTRSCGCLQREVVGELTKTHGYTCGGAKSKLYSAWLNMKTRCYGGLQINRSYVQAGIKVCDRWLHGEEGVGPFECFASDVGDPDVDDHTLERIDNAGDYRPGNTRWATRKEQANNTRRNVWWTLDGCTRTMAQWAEVLGVNSHTLQARRDRGWGVRDILTKPLRSKK